MKAVADDAVRFHTTHFFRVLQAALRSPATAPLSQSDLQLSGTFNRLFAAANTAARHGNRGPLSQMISGARAAHAMIIHRWLSHTDAHHWTYFSNLANWGTAYLDRAAGNEYVQYGNNASTAGYYSAFTDASGAPLNGSVMPAYELTFTKKQIPQASRTGCPCPAGRSTCCCGSMAPTATPAPERSTSRPRSGPEPEVTAGVGERGLPP
jgi:hypothetical protein